MVRFVIWLDVTVFLLGTTLLFPTTREALARGTHTPDGAMDAVMGIILIGAIGFMLIGALGVLGIVVTQKAIKAEEANH